MTSVSTRELCAWLDTTLNAASFKDYCPNGLQVEGREQVSHIIAGVTASQALIDVAIERRADAVLVHHGWFWRGDDPRRCGCQRSCVAQDPSGGALDMMPSGVKRMTAIERSTAAIRPLSSCSWGSTASVMRRMAAFLDMSVSCLLHWRTG